MRWNPFVPLFDGIRRLSVYLAVESAVLWWIVLLLLAGVDVWLGYHAFHLFRAL